MPVCTRCNAVILSQGTSDAFPFALSARQLEVLALLCEGQANKGIARALGISACTVKLHVQGILQKLGASNRVQAVIFAYRHGFMRTHSGDHRDEAAGSAACPSRPPVAFAHAS